MLLVELVALIAVVQFLFFGALTGRARSISGLKAPAMTGDEGFERMYRVQMNTLELLVVFLPALYLASRHLPALPVAAIGLVFVIGRFIYWRAYVSDPSSRSLGFLLSFLPVFALCILTLLGIVLSFAGIRD